MAKESQPYHVPGFRWVRRFVLSILTVFILLISGVCALISLAEMDVAVTAPGTVEPRHRSRIKAAIDGTIKSVLVKSGDRVESGQVVGELDDTALRSQMEKIENELEENQLRQQAFLHRRERDLILLEAEHEQASARVESASLQLEQVSREYRLYYDHSPSLKHRTRPPIEMLLPIRIRTAAYKQSIAELQTVTKKIDTLKDGKLELKRLKAEAKNLRQDRFLLHHRIDALQVRSHVHGTVLTREVDQLVGDQVKKGAEILEIAELDEWQIKTLVGELDFPKVRIGQEARVYVEAFPYTEFKVFRGRVARLPGRSEQVAEASPGVAYSVVIAVEAKQVTDGEKQYSLSYGMKATTKIVIERGSVLTVLWRQLLRSVGRVGRPEIRFADKGGLM